MGEWFFVQRMTFFISQKRYTKVIEKCQLRESSKGRSQGTTYVLALLNYYRKDRDASFNKFKELVQRYHPKSKIKEWFIRNIIASCFFYEKEYGKVRHMCDELIPLLQDSQNLFRVHELNFNAQYSEKDFIAAIKTCDILLEMRPGDTKVQHAKRSIQKSLFKNSSN